MMQPFSLKREILVWFFNFDHSTLGDPARSPSRCGWSVTLNQNSQKQRMKEVADLKVTEICFIHICQDRVWSLFFNLENYVIWDKNKYLNMNRRVWGCLEYLEKLSEMTGWLPSGTAMAWWERGYLGANTAFTHARLANQYQDGIIWPPHFMTKMAATCPESIRLDVWIYFAGKKIWEQIQEDSVDCCYAYCTSVPYTQLGYYLNTQIADGFRITVFSLQQKLNSFNAVLKKSSVGWWSGRRRWKPQSTTLGTFPVTRQPERPWQPELLYQNTEVQVVWRCTLHRTGISLRWTVRYFFYNESALPTLPLSGVTDTQGPICPTWQAIRLS